MLQDRDYNACKVASGPCRTYGSDLDLLDLDPDKLHSGCLEPPV